MFFSIITVNLNNAPWLELTMSSVLSQTCHDYEHIIIDGASTDGSQDVVKSKSAQYNGRLVWQSEKDSGIYNAMNKGLAMAKGEYVQILNSGDVLAGPDVLQTVLDRIQTMMFPSILYGNMIKRFPDGRLVCDRNFAGQKITMLGMYSGTLNHDSAYVKKSLFDKFGPYDESLKICSDWKWFLNAIVIGGTDAVYIDKDITIFDMTGISESDSSRHVILSERRQVMEDILPARVLQDYDLYASDIYKMRRLRRNRLAFGIVSFIERCVFKIEKGHNKHKGVQQWG